MSALTLEQIQWIKDYRNRTGCSLREARDALIASKPLPPSEEDALRSEVSRLTGEVARFKEREEHFAKALSVADGGQYRADWDGAIERVLRERDEARTEVEKLRSRPVACTDCGLVFASIDGLDEQDQCETCRAPAPAETETPAERHERIESWSCPEPGCSMLGKHEGPHRTMVGHGDIDTVEWTTPGAYLAALRPLALARVASPPPGGPEHEHSEDCRGVDHARLSRVASQDGK